MGFVSVNYRDEGSHPVVMYEGFQLYTVGHLLPQGAILDKIVRALTYLAAVWVASFSIRNSNNSSQGNRTDVRFYHGGRQAQIDKTIPLTSELTPSVFGDTRAHGFLPPFRALYVLSTLSVQSPPKEECHTSTAHFLLISP